MEVASVTGMTDPIIKLDKLTNFLVLLLLEILLVLVHKELTL